VPIRTVALILHSSIYSFYPVHRITTTTLHTLLAKTNNTH
jgi:aminoglycoside N3'-acetyltransferase